MSYNAETRRRVIDEILQTEQRYVRFLDILIDCFATPMRQFSSLSPPLLTVAEHDLVFRGLDEIRAVNRMLLTSVSDAVAADPAEAPKLARAFQELTPYLKLYSTFVNKYDASAAKLRHLDATRPSFTAAVDRLQSDSRTMGHDLKSLLIMPVQRIPRYNLLLNELTKHTPPDARGAAELSEACEAVAKIADEINARIADHQNRERIRDVQSQFRGCPDLVLPHRRFVRGGILRKVCRKAVKDRSFVLFTDAILYGAAGPTGLVYHNLLRLEGGSVTPKVDPTEGPGFLLETRAKSMVLFTSSVAESDVWVGAIRDQVQHLESVARLRSADGQVKAAPRAAVWVPDFESPTCALCEINFSFLNRRHHCRQCGKIVCANCSPHRTVLAHIQSAPVRICRSCFQHLRTGTELSKVALEKATLARPPSTAPLPAKPAPFEWPRPLGEAPMP
jgi:hypothetical protein